MKRLSTACVATFMLLTAVPPFGGGAPAQRRAAGAPAECDDLLKQSTALTNEMLDLERAQLRNDLREKIDGNEGYNETVAAQEDYLKDALAGRVTPEMGLMYRRSHAEELGVAWNRDWDKDLAGYYKMVIGEYRRKIQETERRIKELTDDMVKEPGNLTDAQIKQGYAALKLMGNGLAERLEKLKCEQAPPVDESQSGTASDKLLRDLESLEKRAAPLAALRGQLDAKGRAAAQHSIEATNAAARAGEYLNSLRSLSTRQAFKALSERCAPVESLKQSIHQSVAEAQSKERLQEKLLGEASELADSCTTKEQGDSINQKHRSAFRLVADIGTLAKSVRQSRAQMVAAKNELDEGASLLRVAERYYDNIKAEINKAQVAYHATEEREREALTLLRDAQAKAGGLMNEYLPVRKSFVELYPANVDSPLRQRVAALGELLTSTRAVSPPDLKARKEVASVKISEAEEVAVAARTILDEYQGTFCDIETMDEEVEKIEASLRNATFELGLVADLPGKAASCEGRQSAETSEDAEDPHATGHPQARRTPADETPEETASSEAAPAGSLSLTGPWVKESTSNPCCGGKGEYIYSAATAIRRDSFPPSEGGDLTLKWDFIGVPNGALTPGQTIRIDVKGTLTTSLPNRDLEPPSTGSVRADGLEVIQQQHGYVNKANKRDGLYIFKVPLNATSVTIEIGADYGIGTFAVYRYGVVKK